MNRPLIYIIAAGIATFLWIRKAMNYNIPGWQVFIFIICVAVIVFLEREK